MAGISWDDQKKSGEPLRRTGVTALVAGLIAVAVPASAAPAPVVDVIVLAEHGHLQDVAELVTASGGSVSEQIDLVGGLVAAVPSDRIPDIASSPGVRSVTEDVPLASAGADASGGTGTSPDDGASGDTSISASAEAVGVNGFWADGIDGTGVDVALIDSGVVSTTAVDVVNGPDLSFEAGDDRIRHTDTFGHGTHLAGIIAGRDLSGSTGIAPGSRIVNVKVADGDGLTDVSQVIAAIDWVVEHRHANGMNIRVLNLAFGTNSAQRHTLDPLAFAAEEAWKHGIVVVVAAGNEGTNLGRLNNPATDPNLLAVGAVDVAGTTTTDDDSVPTWSSRGDGRRNPDVVAPGVSVPSLLARGSRADREAPAAARVGELVKGSGTSQSAAFVSGVAALMLDADPSLSPDQVKAGLVRSAERIQGVHVTAAGRGVIRADRALDEARAADVTGTRSWSQGTGSLEGSRGDAHILRDGQALEGEVTVIGEFDTETWKATGSTWSGSTWSGSAWSGGSWLGSSWSGSTWSGSTWSGSTWSGSTWSGSTWSTWGWR